jgi:hypothetical protein
VAVVEEIREKLIVELIVTEKCKRKQANILAIYGTNLL